MRPGRALPLFFITSALVAAGLAEVLGFHGIWGNHEGVFLDFLVPIPVATGVLHVPSWLMVGCILGLGGDPAVRVGQRLACAGVLGAGVLLLWDSGGLVDFLYTDAPASLPALRLELNPLGLFLAVDGGVGLVLSFLGANDDGPPGRIASGVGAAVALALPLLALGVFHRDLFGGGDALQVVWHYPLPERGRKLVLVHASSRVDDARLVEFSTSRYAPAHDTNRSAVELVFLSSKRDALELRPDSAIATVCLAVDRDPIVRPGLAPCSEAVTQAFDDARAR